MNGEEVRKKGVQQGRARDARAQARDAEVRALGQEGDEPEAGDRDRPVGGEARGRQGPEPGPFPEERRAKPQQLAPEQQLARSQQLAEPQPELVARPQQLPRSQPFAPEQQLARPQQVPSEQHRKPQPLAEEVELAELTAARSRASSGRDLSAPTRGPALRGSS
jgi:hypothetical protein